MINIEIKARYPDRARAHACLRRLKAEQHRVEWQRDTYFVVPRGRLKLRERDGGPDQLIYYERPNRFGPKRSDYDLLPVEDGEAWLALLSRFMDVWGVVEKSREVWLWENVRIHLDDVRGLGAFLEFEAVIDDHDIAQEYDKVYYLMTRFGLGPDDLVEGSYSDLLFAG